MGLKTSSNPVWQLLGRRNPLRMLSNAMDFRSRKRGNHRPKSADFERVSENPAGKLSQELNALLEELSSQHNLKVFQPVSQLSGI